MAGTVIPRTQLSHVPLADPAGTAGDVTNGNLVQNSGATVFRLKNTAGSSGTATFVPVAAIEDFTITHAAYTIPATTTSWVGKHDVPNFGANVFIQVSAVTILITAFEG